MAIVRIYAVGQKMPSWVVQGCADFLPRFRAQFHVLLDEIPASRREGLEAQREHREKLFRKLKRSDLLVLLDVHGKQYQTEQLAEQLTRWELTGRSLVFAIGGADGWCDSVRQRADQLWSLSLLVFPHALARIIVIEQLYRTDSVRQGHPYHRS